MNYPESNSLDGIRWEKKGPAGYVIFDRAPMNTISYVTRSNISALIAAMDQDPEVRVIVIRGANGVYSSGGDIAGFLKIERDGMHDLAWNIAAPERAKKPVIAAMEKWAMGVAFELSLACDFRIATENTQFALPEITLGTIPGSGGTHRLVHLIGLTKAKSAVMRGRRISSKDALDWGILSELVPDGKIDEAIERWVAELAALPQIPLTSLKRVMNAAYEMPLSIGLQFEGQTFEKLRPSPEFKVGVEAFLQKKKPDFSGY
jgi:2-oxoglutaroyl-CoA hydrolase